MVSSAYRQPMMPVTMGMSLMLTIVKRKPRASWRARTEPAYSGSASSVTDAENCHQTDEFPDQTHQSHTLARQMTQIVHRDRASSRTRKDHKS
jgi:hypothetical protein